MALFLLSLCLIPSFSFSQVANTKWNEIVGKKVVNTQGVTLGYVQDTAIDLERGRYFGLLISSGGFFGGHVKVVPVGAVTDQSLYTMILNMDQATFRQAPTLKLSEESGPPNVAQAVEVYRYYGQQPYFVSKITAAPDKSSKLVQLGFIMKGSEILQLPVQNLQGKHLGKVKALSNLDSRTGRFNGVVIADKIVPPEALRYDFDHKILRLNNHEQAFSDSTPFTFSQGGNFKTVGSPMRPGIPQPPLQQGNSPRDKAITEQITSLISGNGNLSHYAKHIQVGTVHGVTTIRGRVQSQKEKDLIQAYSLRSAGGGNVINQLHVNPLNATDRAVDNDR